MEKGHVDKSQLNFACKHVKLIKNTNMKTLGQYLRELRDRKDLSLREFADKLGGLSAAFLSDIELGKRYPSEKVLSDMARVLGVKLEDLKEYDNRPPINDMKRIIQQNPQFGITFRRVINKEIDKINNKDKKN